MRFDFLAKIINKNWFQTGDKPAAHEWTFDEDLRSLENEQLKQLVSLLFECIEIKIDDEKVKDITEVVKLGKSYILGDMTIDRELILKFLLCITFSQYRIDNLLLHPQEMRALELREICQSIGLPQDMVITIHSNWHSRVIQKKVFNYDT